MVTDTLKISMGHSPAGGVSQHGSKAGTLPSQKPLGLTKWHLESLLCLH